MYLHLYKIREVIPTEGLHKAFESRVRLGIMSALAVNDIRPHSSEGLSGYYRRKPGKSYKGIGKREIYRGREIICREETQYTLLYDERG